MLTGAAGDGGDGQPGEDERAELVRLRKENAVHCCVGRSQRAGRLIQ